MMTSNDQRVIPVTGGVNYRDMGGYRAANGKTVKWHKLVRAGYLSELTTDDERLLQNYGITTDIDFRSSAEVTAYPDQVPTGIKFIHMPVFDDDETESTGTAKRLQRYYSSSRKSGYWRMLYVYRRLVINEQPQRAYRRFFDYLLAHGEDETILFHCSAGKDRTGMGAILVLFALGVSLEDVRNDYMLTNQYSVPRIEKRVAEAKKAYQNPCFISSIRDLSSVSVDYFDQSMTLINYVYGGIRAYLRDVIGVTDAEIVRLRAIYLE